jgi:Mrp family chromosome partitioning ATPase
MSSMRSEGNSNGNGHGNGTGNGMRGAIPAPAVVAGATGAVAIPPRRGKELQKIHRLMRGRYKWAILLGALLGAGLGYMGFRTGETTYQSAGLIRIMPVVPKLFYTVDEKGQMPAFDTYMDGQMVVIKSQRVLMQALDDPKAWEKVSLPIETALQTLMKNVQVSRQGEMIWVKAVAPNPDLAMAMSTAVCHAYELLCKEIEDKSEEDRRNMRNGYISRLQTELGELRQKIKDRSEKYGTDDLRQTYAYRLSDVNRLQTAYNDWEQAMKTLSPAQADVKPADPSAATQPTDPGATTQPVMSIDDIAAVDANMRTYLGEQMEWDRRIKHLAVTVGERHPQMIAAQTELKMATDQVERYAQEWRQKHPPGAGNMPKGLSLIELKKRMDAAKERLDTATAEMQEVGKTELDIAKLEAQADSIRVRLDEALRTVEQTSVESQTGGRLKVMNYADKPLSSYRDTRVSLAAAGGLGGMIMGFGLVLLTGTWDRRMKSHLDADDDSYGIPLLGLLPVLPDDLADADQAAHAVHCVHEIRTHLQIQSQELPHQVLVITGPTAGTGKTSLSLALGVSFASSHHRTLLIDCDLIGQGLTCKAHAIVRRKIGQVLRRDGIVTEQQLDEALRLATESNRRLGEVLIDLGYASKEDVATAVYAQNAEQLGLLDALSGEDVEQCVAGTGIENLWVLPLGDANAQQVGRLSPAVVGRLIAAARDRFDVIIIDTGPIPGSLEAAVVCSQADAVILTVSRGEHRNLYASAVAHLASMNCHVAGVVFNRADPTDFALARSSASGFRGSSSVTASARRSVHRAASEPSSKPFGPIATAVAEDLKSASPSSSPAEPSSSSAAVEAPEAEFR